MRLSTTRSNLTMVVSQQGPEPPHGRSRDTAARLRDGLAALEEAARPGLLKVLLDMRN